MKVISMTLMALALSACAHQEMDAPCKNYGKYCQTERINGWG